MKTPQTPFLRRVQMRLAQARFLTFSALLHVVIVIMGGSVVLIKNIAEPPDFRRGNGRRNSSRPDAGGPTTPERPRQRRCRNSRPPTPQASAPSIPGDHFQLPRRRPLRPARFADGDQSRQQAQQAEQRRQRNGRGDRQGDGRRRARGRQARFLRHARKDRRRVSSARSTTSNRRGAKSRRTSRRTSIARCSAASCDEDWRESMLNDYFKAPKPLYATQIMIPNMPADEGPKAFAMEKEVQPSRWLVHYKGARRAAGRWHVSLRRRGRRLPDRALQRQGGARSLLVSNDRSGSRRRTTTTAGRGSRTASRAAKRSTCARRNSTTRSADRRTARAGSCSSRA